MQIPSPAGQSNSPDQAREELCWAVLGAAPLATVATSITSGLGIGLATLLTGAAGLALAWSLRGRVPIARHPLSALLVIAAVITLTGLTLQAFGYELFLAIGAGLPLLAINGSLLGQADELAADRHGTAHLRTALATVIGLAAALCLLGFVRDLAGRFLGDWAGFHLAARPAGAFLALAALSVAANALGQVRGSAPARQ